MSNQHVQILFTDFLKTYNTIEKDNIWSEQSIFFKSFWQNKIENGNGVDLKEFEIDQIIKILDRNGKGNTKESESVARAMIPQGAWRRLFYDLCETKETTKLISKIFEEKDTLRKALFIDQLYVLNEGKKNRLTGQSGNAINAMLATYDPVINLSMISLNDRLKLIHYFNFELPSDFSNKSLGTRFIQSNQIIIDGFKSLGITGSSRTISCFCYADSMKALWRNEITITKEDDEIVISIPTDDRLEEVSLGHSNEPRESIQMQALLAEIGQKLGMNIWVPRSDRSRILQKWKPESGVLLETLPLQFNVGVIKTIENIDVLWIKRNSIIRAFEVEHTTSIYSGLLRMADLLSWVPNIDVALHIVAPLVRQDKVFDEIQRPVFTFLEGGALSKRCTYISYESLVELSNEKNLGFMKNDVIDTYAVRG